MKTYQDLLKSMRRHTDKQVVDSDSDLYLFHLDYSEFMSRGGSTNNYLIAMYGRDVSEPEIYFSSAFWNISALGRSRSLSPEEAAAIAGMDCQKEYELSEKL